jgi:hypothetical protein
MAAKQTTPFGATQPFRDVPASGAYEAKDEGFDFNPRDYSADELAVIEAASKLIIKRRAEKERAHTLSARFVDPDGAAEA